MYFAAYTVPNSCTECSPSVDTPSSYDETTDGVDAQWGPNIGGDYASNIVVTTHMLRGVDQDGYSFDGSVHILNVVVWAAEFYKTGQAASSMSALKEHPVGSRIHALLRTRDLSRYRQFAHLYKSLNPSQLRTYDEAYDNLRRGYRLTNQQEVLLEKMAAAMEKGQNKLSQANRKKQHQHNKGHKQRRGK